MQSLQRALAVVDGSWPGLIAETEKPYFQRLWASLEPEFARGAVAPALDRVFSAFALPLPEVKAVILGQDPYPTPGNAVGRAFAVADGAKTPNSLRNIFQEVERCFGRCARQNSLRGWQEQGVLLLNVCLTTRAGLSHAHKGLGWETFTDAALRLLDACPAPIAFLLWGRHAREKKPLIANPSHFVIEAAHPSFPYQGFRGCGCFEKANDLLEKAGLTPIDWTS